MKTYSSRKNQIMKNRELLTPIIEAIILCGRQNIAIRGHRDSGKLMIDQTDDEYENNEGNFREILRYRARGDKQLKLFLESNGHLKYTSATIQNEIIESCNQILLKRIVSRVNSAQCFSILADETADLWQRRLRNLETSNYRNAMEALSICNPEIYPNIFKLLTIFATLPVSTAQNERSFSSLKKIKTYLRNTMGQKRLNGLAMLSINRKDRIESKQVLDELAVKKRRLPLIL
ncbi:uncharacterized protein LOC132936221 [Metopolophium dirhodum]|uniref:uncharacterized protein LOC132936221 n=2 Tax=Metopolophium dirhodum TaxID=44670 RepID=UPI002990541E|nr:uncharacterized protein LOC132936221 [Metopolophium dirhodum]XP_060858894.1 uncharacterized protein LOC132936221 [Metopolophium dirhodum]